MSAVEGELPAGGTGVHVALVDDREDGQYLTIADETEPMTHWITSDVAHNLEGRR